MSLFSVSVSLCLNGVVSIETFLWKCHPVQSVQTRKNKSKDAYVNLQNFVAGGGIRGSTNTKQNTILPRRLVNFGGFFMLCKNDHLKFWPMENHSVSQFFWWASEICARLWPDKDQSFAILFADLFLIEPSKKARLRGDDVFFPGILSMSLSYQSFCVVDGGWNDVDDPGKMVCELWISATFRCRSSVQRARPAAGMLQVYHESWQKHLIKPPKHPVMEQRYLSEN